MARRFGEVSVPFFNRFVAGRNGPPVVTNRFLRVRGCDVGESSPPGVGANVRHDRAR